MARVFLCVMDSVGCGGAPDADAFGDQGANTLGHIEQACAQGLADVDRYGPLKMPVLGRLGLGAAVELASGMTAGSINFPPAGIWGAATEVSNGKDTPSGHWELAGVPVPWDWYYFPTEKPAFPPDILKLAAKAAGTDGTLCNVHSAGNAALKKFGAEHVRTGFPICYTSVDSVFQIAAHEEHFGLERLYQMCRDMAEVLHPLKLGRVIARPFLGSVDEGFSRTANRKDFSISPPSDTLCDYVSNAGNDVHAIGKISDIFSGQGITQSHKGADDMALFDALENLVETAEDGALIFANFVEFDSLYGHRRDVAGYARALETFDARVGRLLPRLRKDDLILFTADHGNDPTWTGTDHTRERVPVVGYLRGGDPHAIGQIGFADVGASVAQYLNVPFGNYGKSFL